MKKFTIILFCLALVLTFYSQTMAGNGNGKFKDCTTIQNGTLMYSAGHYLEGELIETGFDAFGYNYQGHMFSGSFANAYLGRDGFPPYDGDDDAYLAENPGAAVNWVWPYRNDDLIMKWSDEWLSNKDCNGDGILDRGYSCDSELAENSACPGAWLTNHMKGSYEQDGKTCKWTYFTKIVTPDIDKGDYIETNTEGVDFWYNADGTEIGPVIWGAFATIQTVENDKCADLHGATYVSPASPGLGKYNP